MWDKTRIQALLDRDDKAVARALLAIYALQTADEQRSSVTTHSNGVGFSAFDAEFCTDLAQKVKRGWKLTPKQIAVARNKMKRYHRQLCDIANARAPAVAIEPQLTPAMQERVERDRALKQADHQEEERRQRRRNVPGECDCENYDGEQFCPSCEENVRRREEKFNREHGLREHQEEVARMDQKLAHDNGQIWG